MGRAGRCAWTSPQTTPRFPLFCAPRRALPRPRLPPTPWVQRSSSFFGAWPRRRGAACCWRDWPPKEAWPERRRRRRSGGNSDGAGIPLPRPVCRAEPCPWLLCSPRCGAGPQLGSQPSPGPGPGTGTHQGSKAALATGRTDPRPWLSLRHFLIIVVSARGNPLAHQRRAPRRLGRGPRRGRRPGPRAAPRPLGRPRQRRPAPLAGPRPLCPGWLAPLHSRPIFAAEGAQGCAGAARLDRGSSMPSHAVVPRRPAARRARSRWRRHWRSHECRR